MRVMLDTNVLVSMVFFPSPSFARLLEGITGRHDLVISAYAIEEFRDVTRRKFVNRADEGERFLGGLEFETIEIPLHIADDVLRIRDPKDYPILYAAVHGDIDVFITGDKDFNDLGLPHPEILTPSEFLQHYVP